MIVQCEKCMARFQVDDQKISVQGTSVRCSKCRHVFRVNRPAAAPKKSEFEFVDAGGDAAIAEERFELTDPGTSLTSPPTPEPTPQPQPAGSTEEPDLGDELFGEVNEDLSQPDPDEEVIANMQAQLRQTQVHSAVSESPVVEENNVAAADDSAAAVEEPAQAESAAQNSSDSSDKEKVSSVKLPRTVSLRTPSSGENIVPKMRRDGKPRSTTMNAWVPHLLSLPLIIVTICGLFASRGIYLWRPSDYSYLWRHRIAFAAEKGLFIADYSVERVERERQQPLLVVRGTLVNRSNAPVAAPNFTATLTAADGTTQQTQEAPCCLRIPIDRLRKIDTREDLLSLYPGNQDESPLSAGQERPFMIAVLPEFSPKSYKVQLR